MNKFLENKKFNIMMKREIQGTLVPKLILGPFLTMHSNSVIIHCGKALYVSIES